MMGDVVFSSFYYIPYERDCFIFLKITSFHLIILSFSSDDNSNLNDVTIDLIKRTQLQQLLEYAAKI